MEGQSNCSGKRKTTFSCLSQGRQTGTPLQRQHVVQRDFSTRPFLLKSHGSLKTYYLHILLYVNAPLKGTAASSTAESDFCHFGWTIINPNNNLLPEQVGQMPTHTQSGQEGLFLLNMKILQTKSFQASIHPMRVCFQVAALQGFLPRPAAPRTAGYSSPLGPRCSACGRSAQPGHWLDSCRCESTGHHQHQVSPAVL